MRETLHQLVRVAEHTARHHFEQIDVHAVLFAIFLVIIDKIIGRTVEYRAFQRDRRVVGNQIVADRQQIHRTKIRTVLNSWIIGNKRLIWMPLDNQHKWLFVLRDLRICRVCLRGFRIPAVC